jgi:hypothetical protein
MFFSKKLQKRKMEALNNAFSLFFLSNNRKWHNADVLCVFWMLSSLARLQMLSDELNVKFGKYNASRWLQIFFLLFLWSLFEVESFFELIKEISAFCYCFNILILEWNCKSFVQSASRRWRIKKLQC